MKMPIFRSGLTLVIILLLVLTTGCMEKSTPEQGIRQQSSEEEEVSFHPLTFEEGINLMNDFFSDDLAIQNGSPPVYYANGRGVNLEGYAEQWIIGTEINNDRYFVIVESNRQILVPYRIDVPEEAVRLDTIIFPGAIITRNTQMIREAFGSNGGMPLLRIELKDNIYMITPSAASVNRILYFDAVTGERIKI